LLCDGHDGTTCANTPHSDVHEWHFSHHQPPLEQRAVDIKIHQHNKFYVSLRHDTTPHHPPTTITAIVTDPGRIFSQHTTRVPGAYDNASKSQQTDDIGSDNVTSPSQISSSFYTGSGDNGALQSPALWSLWQ